ncbi:Rid family hydrolase [Streptomyces reniochalinae]|uniref:Enamine deaminase RidA n=1 Tax=Streptomyces reniochalinae TaxID=2250578 RepID=A0A367ERT1_9ACTN|nr:Rid family hydrolase [Streptomyces reniochalinae]RCG20305.1 enamine deaminase RidA [Streptomyces reniochalinae]
MHREDIDPRFFGGKLAYNRAVVIEQPQRWLAVAGHEARDDEGGIAAEGDIRGQIRLTFQRLAETLDKAGFALSDLVQIRIFTVDIAAVTAHYDTVLDVLAEADSRPTSLLAEVRALSDPRMLIEIEGLAAQ